MNSKTRQIFWALLVFLFYVVFVAVLSVFSVVIGVWSRWLDLALYVGNVGGLACSIYILANVKKTKLPLLLWVGLFVFLVNSWQIIKFFM